MNRDSFLIEADELVKKVGNENIRIYDATITDDMYLMGHIPGAAYFDHERFSDLSSRYMCTILSKDKLVAQIDNLLAEREAIRTKVQKMLDNIAAADPEIARGLSS